MATLGAVGCQSLRLSERETGTAFSIGKLCCILYKTTVITPPAVFCTLALQLNIIKGCIKNKNVSGSSSDKEFIEIF